MCLRSSGVVRPRLAKMLFGFSTRVARGLPAGLTILLLFIGTSTAQAGPLFTATVGSAQDFYPTITNQGSTAVDATLNSSVPSGGGTDTKNQFAAAGPSGLRASPRVTLSASYSGLVPGLADATDVGLADAKMQFDDLRFVGLGLSKTQASLNLDLSGTFLTNVNAFFDMGGDPSFPYVAVGKASAAVSVSVTVPDVIFGGTPQGQVFSYFQSKDTSGNFTGSLFDSGRITTQPFSFYNGVNNHITIELRIRVTGEAGGLSTSFDAFADSLADFAHTVTFATSGPVFNVPDGITVNSVEAQITDNAFVPEPSTAALLVIGCVVALFARRR